MTLNHKANELPQSYQTMIVINDKKKSDLSMSIKGRRQYLNREKIQKSKFKGAQQ